MLALLVLAAPANAAEGPAYSVPEKDLAAALQCPKPGATVLLVPGTNLEPAPNYDWNYEPALDAAKIPWCAVKLPRFAMGDIQASAEYVVYALRRMSSQAGRRVSVIGFSQGGMIGRWALKWWPDTRGMVDDLIGLAPSNHGTLSAEAVCSTSCPAAYWQQRADSKFTAALNAGPETFAGIDYTVAFTHNDEVVTPNADEATGSSALRTGEGRRRNVAIQDICPLDSADHLTLGSSDPVGWALAYDALTHDGPADPARVDAAVCSQPFMPGVDAAQFPANWARYVAAVGQGGAQADYIDAEPPLRCYVTNACPAQPAPAAKPQTCTRRLKLDRRFKRAKVTANGKRIRVRRVHGRLVVTVRVRGTARVRIRGTLRSGRHKVVARAITC